MVLLALIGGAVVAQEAPNDDFGIWYVQGSARALGGNLQSPASFAGVIKSCNGNGAFCHDQDGFLTYFGNSADMSMDASYTITVDSAFNDPKIAVSTYYDSLHIEEHAAALAVDVHEFAAKVGLDPVCNHPAAQVCDTIQTIPIGRIFAFNERGSNALTFRPVPGDIGAYLITISTFDHKEAGPYSFRLSLSD